MQLAKAVRLASNIALVITFFNGLGFILASIVLGGTFCPGEGGVDEYYLCAGAELTRVSKHVFYYSLWHALSVLAGIGIMILLALWSQWLWRGRPEVSLSPNQKASALDYVILAGGVIFATSIVGLMIWMAWSG